MDAISRRFALIAAVAGLCGAVLIPATHTVAQPPVQSSDNGADSVAGQAQEAYQQGDYAKAAELADQALQSNSSDHLAMYIRGSARIELGLARQDTDLVRQGITDAREAIRLKAEPYYYLPYLYGMTNLSALEGRDDHAIVAVQVVDQLLAKASLPAEQKANLRYQRALANLQRDETDEAVADLSQVLQTQPKHLAARMALADLYTRQQKFAEARDQFDQAITEFPTDPVVLNNRGMFLLSQQDLEAAKKDFEKAAELQPNFLQAYLNLGYAELQAGNPEQAEQQFARAIEAEEKFPAAYSMRGTARLVQGELEDATSDYRRAAELNEKNPVAHSDLGFALFYSREYEESAQQFARALELDSQMRFLLPWLYSARLFAGDSERASELADESAARSAEDQAWFDKLVLYLDGRINDEALLAAIDRSDENVQQAQSCEAYYFQGLKDAAEGNREAAVAHFEQALETEARRLSAYRGAQYATGQL